MCCTFKGLTIIKKHLSSRGTNVIMWVGFTVFAGLWTKEQCLQQILPVLGGKGGNQPSWVSGSLWLGAWHPRQPLWPQRKDRVWEEQASKRPAFRNPGVSGCGFLAQASGPGELPGPFQLSRPSEPGWDCVRAALHTPALSCSTPGPACPPGEPGQKALVPTQVWPIKGSCLVGRGRVTSLEVQGLLPNWCQTGVLGRLGWEVCAVYNTLATPEHTCPGVSMDLLPGYTVSQAFLPASLCLCVCLCERPSLHSPSGCFA